jgi:hypothetical protein
MAYALLKPEEIVKMYHAKKLFIFIKTLVLLTGLLTTTGAVAEAFFFNSECGTCHGLENIGTNVEGVVIPPVRDGSLAGIINAINTVPEHEVQRIIIAIGAENPVTEHLPDFVAELAALNPPACTLPQTLVNGVCTTPAPSCTLPQTLVNGVCTTPAPSCTLPQTLINGVCAIPPPPACDNSTNTPLCTNLLNQTGSLGSADTAAAKTDVYKVTCPKPAVAVIATISGLTAGIPAKLSIQLSKGGAVSRAIIDKANGDSIASKAARLAKGSGVYRVKINKTKAGVPGIVQYDATISCLAKNKAQVGANVVIQKNQ